jgi:hypothetical protein
MAGADLSGEWRIKMDLLRVSRVALIVSFLVVVAGRRADAQAAKPTAPDPSKSRTDQGKLVKEIMAIESDDEHQCIALWTPFEMFVGVVMDQTGKDAAEAGADLAFLRNYIVVITGDIYVREGGARRYAGRRDLEERASLKLASGAEFPMARRVPAQITEMSEAMKAVFADMLGEFGHNLHVLIFDATAKDGKTRIDSKKKNTLVLSYKGRMPFKASRLEWKTPFDAIHPIPPCKRCSEPLSGKWSFCPWCGAKIEAH